MTALLRVDASIAGAASASRVLTDAFASAWRGPIASRDLGSDPLPHLPAASLHWPADQPAGLADAVALQNELIAEVDTADVILIGSPLYNYSLASSLKAWIDHLHVPGRTTVGGTQPLAGRTAVIATTRGAVYDDDLEDWATPPLRKILEHHLGMAFHVVTADATLATTVPELAGFTGRAEQQRADAVAELERLAESLQG